MLIGAVPTRLYGHDVFIYLGNGWRIINGQRPHVDFTSPWGPIGYLVSALGLTISRHSVDGIGYGSAILAFIVGSWSFFLGKNRLASAPRLLLSFFLAALVAAPYAMGDAPFSSSHAMLYNRYGYGLIGLILFESMSAPRRPSGSQRDEWIGGVSTGAALALTLFLKASYFFMGVALVVVIGLFPGRVARQRVLGILLGFLFVSICTLAYLRFDLIAIFTDLRMAAAARAGSLGSPVGFALNHASALLGVLLFAIAAALLLGNRVPQWRGLKLVIIGFFVFCGDVGLILSNKQGDGFVLCAVFAILIVNEITEHLKTLPSAEARSAFPAYVAVLFLGALVFLPQFASDLAGLTYGCWQKERPSHASSVLRFTSPNLRPLLLYDAPGNPPAEGRLFATYVNDGVALLDRETRPDETILTMDMTNPFPYAMERRPPRGGHAAPVYNYNISDGHRPSDDWYFADADIVMVPKRASQGDKYYSDFYKAYEPGLMQRYELAAEDSVWWMYRRKR